MANVDGGPNTAGELCPARLYADLSAKGGETGGIGQGARRIVGSQADLKPDV